MTSLIGWVGVDQNSPSSVYLASDSRLSWGETESWNFGRKLFTATKSPDILGYCGDVLFPSLVLARVIDLIDSGLLLSKTDPPDIRFSKITDAIQISFDGYPQNLVVTKTFDVVYCTRQGEGMNLDFYVSVLSWHIDEGWSSKQLNVPMKSGVIFSLGSGKSNFEKWFARWENTEVAGTSRAVFGAFWDSVYSGDDRYSGGAAQMVGIYREGEGKTIGFVEDSKCFVFGLPVPESENLAAIE